MHLQANLKTVSQILQLKGWTAIASSHRDSSKANSQFSMGSFSTLLNTKANPTTKCRVSMFHNTLRYLITKLNHTISHLKNTDSLLCSHITFLNTHLYKALQYHNRIVKLDHQVLFRASWQVQKTYTFNNNSMFRLMYLQMTTLRCPNKLHICLRNKHKFTMSNLDMIKPNSYLRYPLINNKFSMFRPILSNSLVNITNLHNRGININKQPKLPTTNNLSFKGSSPNRISKEH